MGGEAGGRAGAGAGKNAEKTGADQCQENNCASVTVCRTFTPARTSRMWVANSTPMNLATLDKARVNSVTLCARCHHGHLYYDSKVHPQLIHPNLPRPNLLLEQIEACQKNDIR